VELLDREWLEQFVNLHGARAPLGMVCSRAPWATTVSADRMPSAGAPLRRG
jgi:hypothetical protein